MRIRADLSAPPIAPLDLVTETELPAAQSLSVAQAVREALARRRMSRQALADAARISVSTLEKALSGRRPFTLATTIRLEEALGQRLRDEAVPAGDGRRQAPDALGAYTREAAAWLAGRYLTLRPSFGVPDAIFAYRTEIAWDPGAASLVFREAERLDAPFAQTGHVSVPNQSGTIYLVTNWHGQYRLALLGRPTIRREMYGVLTTLQAGRGSQLTPVACPIALVPEDAAPAGIGHGRLTRGMAGFGPCRAHLGRIGDEGFAAFFPCPD